MVALGCGHIKCNGGLTLRDVDAHVTLGYVGERQWEQVFLKHVEKKLVTFINSKHVHAHNVLGPVFTFCKKKEAQAHA